MASRLTRQGFGAARSSSHQSDELLLQLAKGVGISRSCPQNRLRQADTDDRLTSAEKKELAKNC